MANGISALKASQLQQVLAQISLGFSGGRNVAAQQAFNAAQGQIATFAREEAEKKARKKAKKGRIGRIAGTIAGTAIGGPIGGKIGGELGSVATGGKFQAKRLGTGLATAGVGKLAGGGGQILKQTRLIFIL